MNNMKELRDVCNVNQRALNQLVDGAAKMNMEATILSHQAQAAEGLGNPNLAIVLNNKVKELRSREKPQNIYLLCKTFNNLGYCCNTANRHSEAREYFEKSNSLWNQMVSGEEKTGQRPYHHLANHARCLMYLEERDEAESMFKLAISGLENEKKWAMRAQPSFEKSTKYTKIREIEGPAEHARNLFKHAEALLKSSNSKSEAAQKLNVDAKSYLPAAIERSRGVTTEIHLTFPVQMKPPVTA
ncbi:hypothetical protein QQS21_010351 [Conoideocrella luteorostrata]|uniref:Tetratricopeptide repeat protein n=1 Tax=Conoideocrella luteorostrata TaxID=1105319 RepID=A0AAJ0CG44_9HYPO|nr:hypothetical protein QQS21_010351 [Conoideocrella luteorostrata]